MGLLNITKKQRVQEKKKKKKLKGNIKKGWEELRSDRGELVVGFWWNTNIYFVRLHVKLYRRDGGKKGGT